MKRCRTSLHSFFFALTLCARTSHPLPNDDNGRMERINHEGDKGTVRILTEDTHMNTDILVTNDMLRRDLQSDMLLSQDQQRSTPLHDLPMEQPPSNRFRAQHSNSKGKPARKGTRNPNETLLLPQDSTQIKSPPDITLLERHSLSPIKKNTYDGRRISSSLAEKMGNGHSPKSFSPTKPTLCKTVRRRQN